MTEVHPSITSYTHVTKKLIEVISDEEIPDHITVALLGGLMGSLLDITRSNKAIEVAGVFINDLMAENPKVMEMCERYAKWAEENDDA